MTVEEQRIRELAYHIWLSEGCPEGQHDRHWQMACKLAEAEVRAETPAPRPRKPAAPRKPRAVAAVSTTSGGTPLKPVEKKPRASRSRPAGS
ncbi:Protein of unknown function [Azotobacter beijerinckii]|uniref:DUF2934 domain-containing protein n=2 Tax=Azotobacter beijerinckii TaxID=170623 RepID=A0A1H9JQ35_9GAMM|nr:DUF2934 domain-containing protein [Azotobacter beijerinckii]SEQ89051.1 Protein of unknown function [Azotobacter beijerinckii]